MKKRIGLISAVRAEGLFFINKLRHFPQKPDNQYPFYRGRFCGKDIVYSISGIGKTNAARTATLMVQNHSLQLVINFGIGGAYPSSHLGIGDIVVAEKEVYGDEGVLERDGFHGTEHLGIPLVKKGRKKYFNAFPLDKKYIRKTLHVSGPAQHSVPGINLRTGTFVTVSACTGTRKRATELQNMFGAICENMEGAAVAHICTVYDVPMIEIRGISNIVDTRDTKKWNIRRASENCQRFIFRFLESL